MAGRGKASNTAASEERSSSAVIARWQPVISLAVVALMAMAWELLAHLISRKGSYGEPLFPSWEFIFTDTIKRMSDYWVEDWGAPAPSLGGQQTYLGAFLALGSSSLITGGRVFGGLLLGSVTGVGLGLLVSASRLVRRLVGGPMHILRMAPLLAMVPLFALWFGAQTWGIILFIAYGVAVVFIVGTINAVSNIPPVYFDRAATLGASRWQTYITIVVPSIFPELRSSIMLCLGLAWTLVVGGELLGADKGLGVILLYAEQFAYSGRMIVIALLFVLYAGVSYALFEVISRRMIDWHPAAEERVTPAAASAQAMDAGR